VDSTCVRRAILLAEGDFDRKAWIDRRLEEPLGNYLLLVDYTGRLFREGKAVISAEVAGILERLGSSAESWWSWLEKLSRGRLLGRFLRGQP